MITAIETFIAGNLVLYSLITGFLFTLGLVPIIVNIAKRNRILNWPEKRSSHFNPTPALGGIAIFAGFIIPYLLFSKAYLPEKIIIISASSSVFILGLIDDLKRITAYYKLTVILLLALLISVKNELAVFNLHGIFGITELPAWAAYVFTIGLIVFIVNSINLLDGIDGLAGGIGILILSVFSCFFYKLGDMVYFQMNIAMIAALGAFLIYNMSSLKYKIFMGDSGSLVLGFLLSMNLITFFRSDISDLNNYSNSPAVLILSLFVVPVFDSFHVAIKRILLGRSIFHPDRNHIHHTYLKLGFSHLLATLILMAYTVFFFILGICLLSFLNATLSIIAIACVAFFLWQIPEIIIRRNPRKYVLKRNRYKNGKNGIKGGMNC